MPSVYMCFSEIQVQSFVLSNWLFSYSVLIICCLARAESVVWFRLAFELDNHPSSFLPLLVLLFVLVVF